MTIQNKNITILYDFLFCMGGAEKTSLKLLEHFPGARLCVDFVNKENFQATDLPQNIIELGRPCSCQPLNALKGMHNFKSRTNFLKECDLAIYSGSYAPCAVHNQTKGRRILYCHTLPRFAYDLYDYYLEGLPALQKPVFKALVHYTRKNYEAAIKKMDLIIANSQNVKGRLEKYLGMEAAVINPPVETERFKWIEQGDFYLSTARLEKYKRVDLIVEAFRQMPDKKLVVASGGSELENLRNIAGDAPNISFTGWTSLHDLEELMGRAIASIYIPKNEDFGMSPVESMAAGKPVIGAAEGGILETIVNGRTGRLIPPESDEIIRAVQKLDTEKALTMKKDCIDRAKLFSEETFISKMEEVCL